MLTCDKITCRRGGNALFEALSLELSPGESMVVRGPNGSGKTTLLKAVAGSFRPQEGAVRWEGQDIRSLGSDYYRHCVYIGHRSGMKPLATVFENLAFYAGLYDTRELMAPALRYLRLEAVADARLHTLSQGWQRRVGLGRLMLSDTRLWLLDEPWSNLDEEGAEMVTNLLTIRMQQGGMALIAHHGAAPFGATRELTLGAKT